MKGDVQGKFSHVTRFGGTGRYYRGIQEAFRYPENRGLWITYRQRRLIELGMVFSIFFVGQRACSYAVRLVYNRGKLSSDGGQSSTMIVEQMIL